MAKLEDWLGLPPAADLPPSEIERLRGELMRRYPELRSPSLRTLASVPFYAGMVLLELSDPAEDEQVDAGRGVRYAIVRPGTCIGYMLDRRGAALDRLDRLAPLALTGELVEAYLRLRLCFLTDPQGRGFDLVEILSSEVDANRPGGFTARLRIAKVQEGGAGSGSIRHGEVTARLDPAAGIIHVGQPDQWLKAAEEPDAALQAAVTRHTNASTDLVRVATPFFVERWEERWTPPKAESGLPSSAASLLEPTRSLLAGFQVPADRRHLAVIRSVPLRFYRGFKLFELTFPESSEVTGYCLGRPSGDAWEFIWLNGTSPPIHDANARIAVGGGSEIVLGDDPAPDGTEDRDERVAAYLRFFCWAIEGQDGPFFVPERLDRLELEAAPSTEALERIPQPAALRRPGAAEVPADSDGSDQTFRLAPVIYNGRAFEALFALDDAGLVRMIQDSQLEVAVPIDIASMRAGSRRRWSGPTGLPVVRPAESEAGEEAVRAPSREFEDGRTIVRYERFDQPFEPGTLPASESLHFTDCTFEQGLNLAEARFGGSLVFHRCTFGDPGIDIARSTIGGSLRFVDCHVQGDLDATAAKIDGDFDLLSCNVHRAAPNADLRGVPRADVGRSATFAGASAQIDPADGSSVRCQGLRVGRSLLVSIGVSDWRTVIAGSLNLSGATIGRTVTLSALICGLEIDLSGAEATHGVMIGSFQEGFLFVEAAAVDASRLSACRMTLSGMRLRDETSRASLRGLLDLTDADVRGDLICSLSTIGGDLTLYGAKVEGNVVFIETMVNGTISFVFSTIGRFVAATSDTGSLRSFTLRCGGNVEFSGADIGGIDLTGVEIDGDVIMVSGKLGVLYAHAALLRGGDNPQVVNNRLRQLHVRNVHVTGDVRLLSLEAGRLHPALLPRMSEWVDRRHGTGVLIENCTMESDLTMSPRGHGLYRSLQERHARLLQHNQDVRDFVDSLEGMAGPCLEIRRQIVGDLTLRANRIEGSVDLSDITVLGTIGLADSQIGIDLGFAARRLLMGRAETGLQTRCCNLDLEKIVCTGDVDLTGLSVEQELAYSSGPYLALATGAGSLTLRDAEIKGDLQLIRHDRQDWARISGRLDLAALKVSKMTLSQENVVEQRPADKRQAWPARLSLERAEVSRLEVLEPTPSTIDLTAIKVGRWSFGENDVTAEYDVDVDKHIELLNNMTPIDRSVWIAVETELRNQGSDDEANRVYRAMRKRTRSRMSGLTWLLDSMKWWATRYGTAPWRPLCALAPFVAALLFVLSEPANVAPKVDLVQAQGGSCAELAKASIYRQANLAPCEKLTPTALGYRWSWLDGFSLAIRYGVPVVDLVSEEDWRAADHDIMFARSVRGPDGRMTRQYASVPITVSALSTATSAIGWIAWSIILIFLGTRIVRGQRS